MSIYNYISVVYNIITLQTKYLINNYFGFFLDIQLQKAQKGHSVIKIAVRNINLNANILNRIQVYGRLII